MNLTNMTLDDWYNVWIEYYKKEIVRANTCKNYETNYRIRIKGRLGKKRLEDITSLDCQRLMDELYDSRKLLLILETGLRAGELGGLKWEDIDFENRQIHVKRTLLYSKAKGGFYFEPPKSKHSVKDIPMTEVAYDLLKRQNIVQKKMQLKSLDWTDEDKYRNLVFTSNTGHAIGHSTLSVTMDLYVHVTDESKKNEMKKMDCAV